MSGKLLFLKPVLFYLFSILIISCSTDPVDRLQGRFSDTSGLIYEVDFSLHETGDAFAEYWIDGDSNHFFSSLSTAGKDHQISILNLLPDTTYNFLLHIRSDGKIRQSRTHQFHTDILPGQLPEFKLIRDKFEFDGYIFLKVFKDPGALILLNRNAKIVWYQLYDTAVVRPFGFTFDDNILSLVDSSIMEETTLDGKLIRRINTREHGIDKIHHELFKNHQNQYVGLTYNSKVIDLSSLNGNKADTVRSDGMVVMDSTGNKIWEWDIFNHADPAADDSILHRKMDWGHANSIAYDVDGHYLVSFRDFNQVWKIHSTSGDILWRMGSGGDFILEETEWFHHQHDVHISPGGYMIMFDNGDHLRGYSRILGLRVDEENFRCKPVVDIKLGPSQTTYRMGSVDMIDERHILVCSPKKILSLTIFNTNGEMVWEVTGTQDSYKAYYLPKDKIEHQRWF